MLNINYYLFLFITLLLSMQQYGGGGTASSYVSSTLYNQPYAAYPPPHNANNRYLIFLYLFLTLSVHNLFFMNIVHCMHSFEYYEIFFLVFTYTPVY